MSRSRFGVVAVFLLASLGCVEEERPRPTLEEDVAAIHEIRTELRELTREP